MRLPEYKGNFPVGVATFRKPIRPTCVYSNARLGDEPALKLEEIAYAIYYPTTKDKVHGFSTQYWLPRPLNAAVAGWAKFADRSYWLLWPVVHFFARFVRLPAQADVPLEQFEKAPVSEGSVSSSETLDSSKKWPLVIFSHGLAGGRFTYSDYCGRLAARGMVVLALEHRDGSGPVVIPLDEETGEPVPKLYIPTNDLNWVIPPSGAYPIRVDQLVFRIREIYESFESFKSLVDGSKDTTVSMDSFQQWDSLKGQVDCSKLVLAGHSFGGATALSLLSSSPLEGHSRLPIDKVILLDPWLEPLPLPGELPIARDNRPPLFIMNSEKFTLWKDHFGLLEQLVADWRQSGADAATLVTIVRSQHHFYSDFALFVPFGKIKPIAMGVLDTAHKLSMACIHGSLATELKGKRGMEVEPLPGRDSYGAGNRQLIGQPGEVIVH